MCSRETFWKCGLVTSAKSMMRCVCARIHTSFIFITTSKSVVARGTGARMGKPIRAFLRLGNNDAAVPIKPSGPKRQEPACDPQPGNSFDVWRRWSERVSEVEEKKEKNESGIGPSARAILW